MSVRISSHDWVEGGITPADAVQIARAFKEAGADLIDCSSGQVSKQEKPIYGRMRTKAGPPMGSGISSDRATRSPAAVRAAAIRGNA